MSPALKFFIKLLVTLFVIAALPFLIEWALRSYDWERDSYVHPAAVTADGGTAVAGLNRLKFREVRFDTTGVEFRLRAFDLLETMRDDNDLVLPGGTIKVMSRSSTSVFTAMSSRPLNMGISTATPTRV